MIKGTIVKRIIRGKERFYHQWRENGQTKSRYLKPEEILPLREQLERIKVKRTGEGEVEGEGEERKRISLFLTGRRLDELGAAVGKLKKRALLEAISSAKDPFLILTGEPESGKTILLEQAIAALAAEDRARAAYLSCPVDFTAEAFLREFSSLYERGIRRFYLDALERSKEVTNLLPSLADTYLPLGCRFVAAKRESPINDELSTKHLALSTSPLSFADFVLLHSDSLTDYLDYLGLSARVKALAPPLSPHFGALARAEALKKLTATLSEQLLKDIVIRAISERRASATTEVFTLELAHGGMDIVIADLKELTCELYEVKYAAERDDKQLARLLNSRNLDQIEHRYGMITTREVFYLGRNAWHASGIYYRNVEKFLLTRA